MGLVAATRRLVFAVAALVAFVVAGPAAAAALLPLDEPTCDLIATAAQAYDLPIAYFTRLIWQESSFRADAVSPAGAQGIAQFMPATAVDRGLLDPFQRREALLKSAAYLRELRAMFGNLGLAAAAYNAGPGRVSRWLAGTSADLPAETYAYVIAVTGRDAASWKGASDPKPDAKEGFSCAKFAALAKADHRRSIAPAIPGAPGKSWAVILVGSPLRERAWAEYQIVRGQYSKILGHWQPSVVHRRISGTQIPRYIVQIEHDSRSAANGLCGQLLRAGGNCFVLANR